MIELYMTDTGRKVYSAFDWIAAIAATHCEYFTWRHVTHEIVPVDPMNPEYGKNIRFSKDEDGRSNLQMASGDVKHLEVRKIAIMDAMRHDVRDYGSKKKDVGLRSSTNSNCLCVCLAVLRKLVRRRIGKTS